MQVERTEGSLLPEVSGERVSNTWATCPVDWDNIEKSVLIPDDRMSVHAFLLKDGFGYHYRMGPRRIS